MLKKLNQLEKNIKFIVKETNESLERSNEKILDLSMKKRGDDFTFEVVESYLDDVICQRQKLLRGGLTLLNSIEVAKNSNLNDSELKKFFISMNKELELLVG